MNSLSQTAALEMLEMDQGETEDYPVEVLGRTFLVKKGVFSPKYFFGSRLCVEMLPELEGKRFLDVGTGTGVIAIFAAYRGAASVVATDISQIAVANAQANVALHGLEDRVEVLCGDVLDPVAGRRFDLIFWNMPYGYSEWRIGPADQMIMDQNYVSIEKFFAKVQNHLDPGGRIVFSFSREIGNYLKLQQILAQNRLKMQPFDSRPVSGDPDGKVFHLYEATA